jgi:hypothetical protein
MKWTDLGGRRINLWVDCEYLIMLLNIPKLIEGTCKKKVKMEKHQNIRKEDGKQLTLFHFPRTYYITGTKRDNSKKISQNTSKASKGGKHL